MTVLAYIGAKGLYLLFVWLLSAAIAAAIAERKGYGERVGLAFGLLLSAVGLILVLLLPGRPGSRWKADGAIPRAWRPSALLARVRGRVSRASP
jgi:NADH:ubiquinone oxidoreductase subunit 6 (subunit J)